MKKILLALTIGFVGITNIYAAPDNGKRPDHSQICNGKAVNSKVSLKNDGRNIEGTCQLGFKSTNLDRGMMRDPAIQKACVGKSKGAPATVKVNGKSITGKCDVIFKPNMQRK